VSTTLTEIVTKVFQVETVRPKVVDVTSRTKNHCTSSEYANPYY